MPRTFTNRQFAAAMRSLGFVKSRLQMTRHGLSYTHQADPSRTLWTIGKDSERALITGASRSHRPTWSASLGICPRWLDVVQADPAFRVPLDLTHRDNQEEDDGGYIMTPREIFLCAARAFAETIPAAAAAVGGAS